MRTVLKSGWCGGGGAYYPRLQEVRVPDLEVEAE